MHFTDDWGSQDVYCIYTLFFLTYTTWRVVIRASFRIRGEIKGRKYSEKRYLIILKCWVFLKTEAFDKKFYNLNFYNIYKNVLQIFIQL